MCTTVLVCEAIVIMLAIPVAVSIAHADAVPTAVVGGGLAMACLLLIGLLRYRWAYIAATIVQLLAIATGVVVSTMFFLGALFGALWLTAIWLGRRTEGAETG